MASASSTKFIQTQSMECSNKGAIASSFIPTTTLSPAEKRMKTTPISCIAIINFTIFYVALSGLIIVAHGIAYNNLLNIILGILSSGFIYGLIKVKSCIKTLEASDYTK